MSGLWIPFACMAGTFLIGFVCGRVSLRADRPSPPPPRSFSGGIPGEDLFR